MFWRFVRVGFQSVFTPRFDLLWRYVMPAGTSLNVNKSKLFQHFVIHDITSLLSEQYSTDSEGKERKEVDTMSLLIILMVMEQNGMYIPAWAMGIAWALLVISFLNAILQIA